MVPVTVCNLALAEIGSRVFLNSLSETSPQGVVANLLYTPKIHALLRTANWDFARGQITLTLWKAAVVNGVVSSNPPPQPWLYSYLYPPDCLKGRFVLPTMPVAAPGTPLTTASSPLAWISPAPTSVPFVPATDIDENGNPIRVLLTNLPAAQLIYTRDLSQVPDLWDQLFATAATAYLASYFINALARNAAQYSQQVAIAKSMIDAARIANGNEGIESLDHRPDWIRSRMVSGANWGYSGGGPGIYGANDAIGFPCGLSY